MDDTKLTGAQKHLIRLVKKGKGSDGWTAVSEALCKTVSEQIPSDLATFEKLVQGGRIQLTEKGESLLMAMAYL